MIEMHASPIKTEARVICDNCQTATELVVVSSAMYVVASEDARMAACAEGWAQVGTQDICGGCKTRQVDLPKPKP